MVKLSADVEGYKDGTKALFVIWERDMDGKDDFIVQIDSKVSGSKVEAEWKYEYHEDTDETSEEDEMKGYSAPEYYFIVKVGDCKARSDILEYKDWIEIELRDQDDKGIANAEYILHLPDGTIRKGRLDGKGYKKEGKIPPGKCFVEFPAWYNVTDVK